MKQLSLTGNQLKIIALLCMTVDHAGLYLFPQAGWMRLVGRLAFPIYAYMIAEGCRHTRSMGRYLGTMAAVAAMCQVVYFVALGSVYQCILVTFSLSVSLIWLVQNAHRRQTAGAWAWVAMGIAAVFCITELLPRLLAATDFAVDYGFWGVMLPVLVYLGKTGKERLLLSAVCLTVMAANSSAIQFGALLALPLLALYNGQRGKKKLKYLFYIYYPAHIVLFFFIAYLL